MKVAITGHTSGLGKEISSYYPVCIGLSRSNGFDIANSQRIVNTVYDCDIFYNNAHCGFHQVSMFYDLARLWANDDTKIIVNISSAAPERCQGFMFPYATEKMALDYASKQVMEDPRYKCNVVLVKPGFVDTPETQHIDKNKIPVDKAAASIVKYVNEFKNGILYMPF